MSEWIDVGDEYKLGHKVLRITNISVKMPDGVAHVGFSLDDYEHGNFSSGVVPLTWFLSEYGYLIASDNLLPKVDS